MKSKISLLRILVIIVCFLFILVFKESFCQEQNKPLDKNESSGAAFEQALKNYDRTKLKDQEELTGKLNFYLNREIESWINTAKKDKAEKLNSRLEQEWEKLASIYPISPGHYDYDLRGYKYSILKSDINKTDSLTFPYQAVVIIKEEMYVEKNHSPNISDAAPYFYTVSTNYTLNLEYKNEKFNLVSSEHKIVSIENKCPDEIKRMRL